MLEIYQFSQEYLDEAELLFTTAYQRLRSSIPLMPLCHEDPATIVPLLSDLSAHNAGAVAILDGKMVGYLLGMIIPEFKSP